MIRLKEILFLSVLYFFDTQAQAVKTKWAKDLPKANTKDLSLSWHLENRTDSRYGANINKAYEYIKANKLKPRKKVVVAVIDGGADIGHEDLKNVLWINTKEIAGNGIDDDRNGYIDDVHGWNFLGSKEGIQMQESSLEGDREFFRLIEKYKFAALDSSKVPSTDFQEYVYFKHKVLRNSLVGKAYESYQVMNYIVAYADTFTVELKRKFPGKSDFTIEDFKTIAVPQNWPVREKMISYIYYQMFFSFEAKKRDVKWDLIKNNAPLSLAEAEKQYEKLYNKGLVSRTLVGDDVDNITDKYYGNHTLSSATVLHGMHVAGIIGADRNNKLGIQGVADIKIMPIRAVASGGDEYDKDIALAIRYAVDQGADIINMSFGKPISPNKNWVDEALIYAQKKGVLVVHAAGNSFKNTNDDYMYPVKHIDNQDDLTNFITVGSHAIDGNPAKSSCYGNREVDVFAPGVNIYSMAEDGGYKKLSGTSMAAPVVSGLAAMILTYYPNISAPDLRKLIMDSSFDRSNVAVLKPQDPMLSMPQSKIMFKELCVTGGIIDAAMAIEKAKEIAGKSPKTKRK